MCTQWHESITADNAALWRGVWSRKYGAKLDVADPCPAPNLSTTPPSPATIIDVQSACRAARKLTNSFAAV